MRTRNDLRSRVTVGDFDTEHLAVTADSKLDRCGAVKIRVGNELARDALPARPEDDIALADPILTAYLDDIAASLRYRVVD